MVELKTDDVGRSLGANGGGLTTGESSGDDGGGPTTKDSSDDEIARLLEKG